MILPVLLYVCLSWLLSQPNVTCGHLSLSICRPCVRCVWTGWRTWSSCAATAPASCAGTEWANAPSAARPSNVASSSTRRPPQTLYSAPPTPAKPQSHQLLLLDHPRTTRSASQGRSQMSYWYNKCSFNGLAVFRWIFCYKTSKKKYIYIYMNQLVLSSCDLTAARKTLASQVLLFYHFSPVPFSFLSFSLFLLETSFLLSGR